MSLDVRINPSTHEEGIPLWLVVHGGYDFDPTVLAVCSSEEKAKEMREEHYSNSENADYPWNCVVIVTAYMDTWVSYDKKPTLSDLAGQALGGND